ncbi:hypothetical protein SCX93_05555 [Legionella pneumophila serogroup 1]
MNSLLDIKQDLLVVPDGETIASNQAIKQSSNQAINTGFSLIFIVLHYILLYFFPLFRVSLYLFARLLSYAARSCIHPHVMPIDCC